MNTRAKGYRREYQCQQKLQTMGYLVDRKNASKYNSNDFYYLFDLVAVRDSQTLWIQVKSRRDHGLKAVRDIRKWLDENNLQLDCQVWYKENYKEWVVLDV
jgi:Holliday junction resolvase